MPHCLQCRNHTGIRTPLDRAGHCPICRCCDRLRSGLQTLELDTTFGQRALMLVENFVTLVISAEEAGPQSAELRRQRRIVAERQRWSEVAAERPVPAAVPAEHHPAPASDFKQQQRWSELVEEAAAQGWQRPAERPVPAAVPAVQGRRRRRPAEVLESEWQSPPTARRRRLLFIHLYKTNVGNGPLRALLANVGIASGLSTTTGIPKNRVRDSNSMFFFVGCICPNALGFSNNHLFNYLYIQTDIRRRSEPN